MAYASGKISTVVRRFSSFWPKWNIPAFQGYGKPIRFHTSASLWSSAKDPKYSMRYSTRLLQIANSDDPRDELRINTMWLRDHCRCSICYNATTNQRSSDIVDLKSKSAVMEASVESKPKLTIAVKWIDGHNSTYELDWIRQNWCVPQRVQLPNLVLWSGDDMKKRGGLPSVAFSDLIDGKNDAMKKLVGNIRSFGVGCVSGAPASFEETSRVSEMVALPEETVYGKFWKFSAENMEHADTAYSTFALGAHTDLTYYTQTAGLQIFHLLEHTGGQGGATLLVDGFKVAEQLRSQDSKAFQLLSTKPIPCHYLDHGAHFFSDEPVIDVHPVTGEIKQFRFNIYDRAPLSTFKSNEEVEEFYRAYIVLAELVRKPENEYWVQLGPGTIVFIDNFRVMHGRSAFTGKRVMCGCYLQRDSFLSKARILGV